MNKEKIKSAIEKTIRYMNGNYCLFLIFIIGVIGFRISFSLGTPHEKEEFNIKIFTKKGHDYLLVDTKHGVYVIHAESCPCKKKK